MSDKKRPLFTLEEEADEPGRPLTRTSEKKKHEKPDNTQERDVRRVVIVGVDIPLSNIILLFLKVLLVVIPVVLLVGALLGVIWEYAMHGA